jgi:hypothetical protein
MNKEELTTKLYLVIGLLIIILTLHEIQSYYHSIDKQQCIQQNGKWVEYYGRSMGYRWSCLKK